VDQRNIVSILHLKSEEGKKVSKAKVRHVWHRLYPGESMPKIEAAVLPQDDYLAVKE